MQTPQLISTTEIRQKYHVGRAIAVKALASLDIYPALSLPGSPGQVCTFYLRGVIDNAHDDIAAKLNGGKKSNGSAETHKKAELSPAEALKRAEEALEALRRAIAA
jgi:hypothetical protein